MTVLTVGKGILFKITIFTADVIVIDFVSVYAPYFILVKNSSKQWWLPICFSIWQYYFI